MTIIVCTAGGVFLLWAAWWVYRGDKRHGKHRIITVPNTPPAVAAHHPLPVVDPTGIATEAWEKAWARPTRHTHRDPTTGRFVPRGKL